MTLSIGSTSAPFIKKLSRAEMVERRAKGLCYNCDEYYTAGHRCKQIFCLMVEDSDEEIEHIAQVDPGGV